jgi:hypothetical protein
MSQLTESASPSFHPHLSPSLFQPMVKYIVLELNFFNILIYEKFLSKSDLMLKGMCSILLYTLKRWLLLEVVITVKKLV